jgi:hypothetical protein
MEQIELFKKNFECAKLFCYIEYHYFSMNNNICVRLSNSEKDIIQFSLSLDKKKTYCIISASDQYYIDKIMKILKMFYMCSIVKVKSSKYSPWPIFHMEHALTKNILNVMVFSLILTKTVDQIKKYRRHAFKKYKLLLKTDYLPREMSKCISVYFIHFIIMCMM